ncbi:hypothetical protein ACFOQM_21310, partial [Paenibacillus sp. GCM10012307]|uniref:hypothetical protein n=1 Tax=Paenibacillus TaxID=44249 RepID=UPI001E2EA257
GEMIEKLDYKMFAHKALIIRNLVLKYNISEDENILPRLKFLIQELSELEENYYYSCLEPIINTLEVTIPNPKKE